MKANKINWFKIAPYVFMLSAVLYLLFLVLLRYNLRPNALLFLVPTISMVITVGYQIFKQRTHPGSENIILFEIFSFALLIHLLHIIPCRAGVFGDDFPQYFYSTKLVMEYGFPIPKDVLSHYTYMAGPIEALSNYLVFVINGGITWLITGIEPITSCRWIAPIWTAIGFLALYLVSKAMFNDSRAALLAILGFSAFPTSVENHSQYIRETIAFVMLLFAIYSFYTAYQRNKRIMTILALLFSISVVLSHYYVSILWIALLLVFVFCSKFTDLVVKQGRYVKNLFVFAILFFLSIYVIYISSSWWRTLLLFAIGLIFIDYMVKQKRPTASIGTVSTSVNQRAFWSFIILAIVVAFAHWIYMETSVLPSLTSIQQDIVRYGSPTEMLKPIEKPCLKEEILAYIGRFLNISFVFIILLEVIRGIRGSCKYFKEDLFIAVWYAMVLILSNILMAYREILCPERVLIFGYPLLLIGIAHAGSNIAINRKRLGHIVMALIIFYTIFNLFSLPVVPPNPVDTVERVKIITIGENEFVYTGYHMPQDPKGIAAMHFYKGMEDGNFTRWFKIGDEKFFTEAYEREIGSSLVGVKPYTKRYLIISPNSLLQRDRLYNNGEIEIYR